MKNSSQKMTRSEKAAKKASNSKKRNRVLIICSVAVVACLILGLGGFLVYNHFMANRPIEANVTVAGVAVQGMTKEEAADAVREAFLLSHRGKQMVIKLGDETITLNSDLTNVQLDADELIKAVAKVSAKSSQAEEFSLAGYVSMNKDAVMPVLQEVTDKLQSTLVQSTYEVTGTAPEAFDKPNEESKQKITITMGTPGISVNPERVYDAILTAYAEGNFAFEYTFSVELPDAIDPQKLFSDVCVAPIDAVMDPETFEVTAESLGFGFDVEALTQALNTAVPGQVLELDYIWLTPAVTKESLSASMFCDVLGDMSTTAGWSETRNKNLRIACAAINGTILMPGETFSFNKLVGATTKDKGYDQGHGYIDGEVAEVIGGGICQVASTLYVASVEADLKIVERYMHAYMPSYMGASTDATVYYPYLDFKFKNDTDRPIMIEATASGAKVTCKILGVDTRDYYVKFETVIVKKIPWQTIYKEYPPDNEEGYTDGQVLSKSSPYSSVESKSFRNKYDKVTNELISSKLENHETYDVRDKVVVKIVDPNAPTNPDGSPIPSPDDTPVPSPEDTPVPSPENTPAPSPESTPEPSPENTPAPSPENTPAPSPENTPAPSPDDTPAGSGEVTEDNN